MNKLHYRGIFDITGELLNATYNPHLFEYEVTQVAYRILTPIENHQTAQTKDLAYSYMGSYYPRGEYRGTCTARLSNDGKLRVSIVGNSQFWDICKKISNTIIKQSSKEN